MRAGGAGAAAARSTFWDLEAFPKTSGSKGMQVYLPLNTPATYEATREFSKGLAHLLARRDPDTS